MESFFNRSLFIFMLFIFCFTILIPLIFIPLLPTNSFENTNINSESSSLIITNFLWPIPGYSKITSPYGKRTSPTNGASFFHQGIDIGASTNSNLIAIADGKVTFTGFSGSGGYTLTYVSGNYQISYCHVSPVFLVSVGDFIKKGQIIAYVGPKNVYNVPNNPYKDSQGRPTNGATTGPHLHFMIRIQNSTIDPLTLYQVTK